MKTSYWLKLLVFLCIPTYIFSYELGIVTMFQNEANYLKEWIEYHRMVGVDHFLLYNHRSTDHWKEVLDPYIQSNLVEVIEWNNPVGTPVFPVWQVMAYKDGLRKSLGNTKWLAFIDVDEFILPLKNATVLDCLHQYYPTASGVYACWRNFGTGGIYINPGEPIITKLTACSQLYHSRNATGKSIVKVEDVEIDKIWYPHHLVLKEMAQYYDGSGGPLYFRGQDLQVNLRHTGDYIRINHYAMRDENFYQNVRLPKASRGEAGGMELFLLLEHYSSFNLTRDKQMIKFLKTWHPTMYKTFWQEGHK